MTAAKSTPMVLSAIIAAFARTIVQTALLLIGQRVVITAHVVVERRVSLDDGPLKGGDGHVGVAHIRPDITEHIGKTPPVFGHEGQSRLHHVVFTISRDATARG